MYVDVIESQSSVIFLRRSVYTGAVRKPEAVFWFHCQPSLL